MASQDNLLQKEIITAKCLLVLQTKALRLASCYPVCSSVQAHLCSSLCQLALGPMAKQSALWLEDLVLGGRLGLQRCLHSPANMLHYVAFLSRCSHFWCFFSRKRKFFFFRKRKFPSLHFPIDSWHQHLTGSPVSLGDISSACHSWHMKRLPLLTQQTTNVNKLPECI